MVADEAIRCAYCRGTHPDMAALEACAARTTALAVEDYRREYDLCADCGEPLKMRDDEPRCFGCRMQHA